MPTENRANARERAIAARSVLAAPWLGLGCTALLAGCALVGDADLLQVDDVRPHRIEVGDRVIVSGRGFPTGREASVRFDGTVRRPGASPIAVRSDVTARALADERVELDADAALVDQLGGGGTFDGAVTVGFPTADGQGRVVGRLSRVQLEIELPARRRLRAQAQRLERARRTFAFLGIEASDERPIAGGVAVAGVAEGGRADAAGLAVGDVIVSVDGARVDVPSDFVTAPGATRATVSAVRGGEVAPVEVDVSVRGLEPVPPMLDLVVDALALLALLAVFAFVAPTARWMSWLDDALYPRRVESDTAARSLWLGRVGVFGVLVIALACAAIIAIPFSARVVVGGLDALAVFVAVSTLRRAALWLEVASGGGRSLLVRALVAVRSLGTDVVVIVALVGAALQAGTLRLSGLVAVQSGAPWDWLAVRSPAGWVLFALFAAALVASRRASSGPGSTPSRAMHVLDTSYLFAACALGVAVFLGGWHVPGLTQDDAHASLWRIAGAVIFALKTLLLAAAVSRISATRPVGSTREHAARAIGGVVLAAAMTTAMMLWPLPLVAEKVLGVTACIALSTLALVSLAGRHRSPRRSTMLVHPFL